jgi:hypothetical protein
MHLEKEKYYEKFLDENLFEDKEKETIKDFLCNLCQGVLFEPVVDEHGHNFCKRCMDKYNSKNAEKKCPITKLEIHSIIPIKLIENVINSFNLKCRNGCGWKGKVSEIKNHLELDCLKAPAECENKSLGCKELIMRPNISEHQNVCNYRQISCSFCSLLLPQADMPAHLELCPSMRVECPKNCNYMLLRSELLNHLQNTCENAESECAYYKVGCIIKMHRKDLSTHNKQQEDFHNSLIVKEILTLKQTVEDIREETRIRRKEVEIGSSRRAIPIDSSDSDFSIKSAQKPQSKRKKRKRSKISKVNVSPSKEKRNPIISSPQKGPTNIYDLNEEIDQNIKQISFDSYNISEGICIIGNRVYCTSHIKNTHKFAFANIILKSEDVRWSIKISSQPKWIAFGVCIKTKVIQNNFEFSRTDKPGFSHSCFGISSNGFTWNCNNQNENNVQLPDFPGIQKDDEIEFSYIAAKQELCIKIHEINITLTKVYAPDNMVIVPCVIFLHFGDDVYFSRK